MSRVRQKRVLVTRDAAGNARLRSRLTEHGCEVVEVPLVALEGIDVELPVPAPGELVVLTSRRAAQEALERWGAEILAEVELAVVGGATARVLSPLVPAHRPTQATAAALVELLAPRVAGRRVHFPSAQVVTGGLVEGLTQAGAEVIRTAVYANRLPEGAAEALAAALPVDVAPLASSSAARRLGALAPGFDAPVVAMGPSTARAAASVGLRVAAVADPPGLEGLVAATLEVLRSTSPA